MIFLFLLPILLRTFLPYIIIQQDENYMLLCVNKNINKSQSALKRKQQIRTARKNVKAVREDTDTNRDWGRGRAKRGAGEKVLFSAFRDIEERFLVIYPPLFEALLLSFNEFWSKRTTSKPNTNISINSNLFCSWLIYYSV